MSFLIFFQRKNCYALPWIGNSVPRGSDGGEKPADLGAAAGSGGGERLSGPGGGREDAPAPATAAAWGRLYLAQGSSGGRHLLWVYTGKKFNFTSKW